MIWTTALKFLVGNWKFLVLAIGILLFYFKANAFWNDYQEYRTQKEQTVLQLTQSRDQALIQVAEARAAMWEKEANEKRLELLLAKAIEEKAAIREEARRQIDVFENHNFEALTKAKPGLIEKLANKATQERLDAFEDAFNN